jgi:hypothetical protein
MILARAMDVAWNYESQDGFGAILQQLSRRLGSFLGSSDRRDVHYMLLYVLAFSVPVMFRISVRRLWAGLLASPLLGTLAIHFRAFLLDPSPFHSLVQMASRIPAGGAIVCWLIASATAYNAILSLFCCGRIVLDYASVRLWSFPCG